MATTTWAELCALDETALNLLVDATFFARHWEPLRNTYGKIWGYQRCVSTHGHTSATYETLALGSMQWATADWNIVMPLVWRYNLTLRPRMVHYDRRSGAQYDGWEVSTSLTHTMYGAPVVIVRTEQEARRELCRLALWCCASQKNEE